jgi:L-arabinose isomerase
MQTAKALGEFEVWFLTGSQDLYGEETLRQVADHSQLIAAGLDESASIPVRVVFKPVVKSPEGIAAACLAATAAGQCVGVIAWMHTFSGHSGHKICRHRFQPNPTRAGSWAAPLSPERPAWART